MEKPDLVFITKSNQQFLKERAEELGKLLPRDPLEKPVNAGKDDRASTDSNPSK